MPIKPKFGSLFIGVLLAITVWYWQTQTLSPAPDVVFKTLNGETIALAELKGKPVLVTFWATDCQACLEEIPYLISLHRQYNQQGLTIIAVAMYYDPPNHVQEMATAKQLPYAVALDPAAELAKAFGNVQFTPTTFLIDKNGMTVMHKIGGFDLSTLQKVLTNIGNYSA